MGNLLSGRRTKRFQHRAPVQGKRTRRSLAALAELTILARALTLRIEASWETTDLDSARRLAEEIDLLRRRYLKVVERCIPNFIEAREQSKKGGKIDDPARN